jgi:hypothetical protein
MRRNIIPIKNSNRNSQQNNSNTHRSILNHINKISSILNAPYLANNQKKNPPLQ